jgi:sugar/nucleoside kinase (ribokinase family)
LLNESEAAAVLGRKVDGLQDAGEAATALVAVGARHAAAAGATAATRPGAQAGMPRPEDILAATGLSWPVR